ncbi:TnpV protein [Butyricicoccus sp. 1XD8-22]|nr:TnpV protein [Butyricicoccus sp. 1XD8-22]
MELTYRTEGDYQLPNLEVPEAPKVGKYGMLRRSYLRTHRNGYYTGMQLSGRLNAHLEKIDREATEMVERLTAQMARVQGVTEGLKASDEMKWVGLMNNIRASAEEVALTELVYTDV